MKIQGHLLDEAILMPSPNVGGVITPTILVLHYTASGGDSADGDAKYFTYPNSKVSAHITVGRDGSIYQSVDFNKKAWHAGVSSWKGRDHCNNFSIGIEIDNWGLLEKENGKYYSHAGVEIPESRVFFGPNKRGGGEYWETYNDKQLEVVERVCHVILESYPSITEVVGHEDIAPGRKIDPGPALYDFIDKLNNYIQNPPPKVTEAPSEPEEENPPAIVSEEDTTETDVRVSSSWWDKLIKCFVKK